MFLNCVALCVLESKICLYVEIKVTLNRKFIFLIVYILIKKEKKKEPPSNNDQCVWIRFLLIC